jgi:hypothetical protein
MAEGSEGSGCPVRVPLSRDLRMMRILGPRE